MEKKVFKFGQTIKEKEMEVKGLMR